MILGVGGFILGALSVYQFMLRGEFRGNVLTRKGDFVVNGQALIEKIKNANHDQVAVIAFAGFGTALELSLCCLHILFLFSFESLSDFRFTDT